MRYVSCLRWVTFCAPVLGICLHAAAAPALLLDFGDGGTYAGTVSPAHQTGAVPNAHQSFNGVGSGGLASGVRWGDGSTAPGVVIAFGVTYTQGGTLSFPTSLGYGDHGANAPPGAQEFDTTLLRDIVQTNTVGEIAARITGLPAGRYEVYTVVHDPDFGLEQFRVDVGPNLTGYRAAESTLVGPVVFGGGFTTPADYVRQEVTLASGDALTVIVDHVYGPGGVTVFPKLNSIEIVPIPEPTAASLLVVGASVTLLYRRRRGSRKFSSPDLAQAKPRRG